MKTDRGKRKMKKKEYLRKSQTEIIVTAKKKKKHNKGPQVQQKSKVHIDLRDYSLNV